VCQFDPLRDEGIEYARRLAHADVPDELHLYPGTFHDSTLVAGAAVSQRMIQDANAHVSPRTINRCENLRAGRLPAGDDHAVPPGPLGTDRSHAGFGG